MNPRLFCRERSYHKALLLTYSFDPIFFEQVVLPDLWAGQSSDIFVLGDQSQIDMSIQTAVGQLCHLGRRYLLAGSKHTGAFHPKVFLRLGPKDGLVMVGSGNVTSSGWGGNQELGASWMIGPEHADKGGWLHRFLDGVLSWCSGELEHDAVHRMKDVPWLNLTPTALATGSPVLHSGANIALAPALAKRWAGRQFDEVKILTGSTDESGAFLRWAHTTFGVTRATIALTPSSSSFAPDKLADLPLDLRIITASADRLMHAKFYWFNGPSGSAAAMGSANCSAAAWLLPPNQGGNIETLVAYDRPTPDDFEGVLNVFVAPAHKPVDVFLTKPDSPIARAASAQEFQLKSLQWDGTLRHFLADICPAPKAGMRVELLLGDLSLQMERVPHSERFWRCGLNADLASTTVFGSVAITFEDNLWTTRPKWVNDIAALEHASHLARLLEPFKGLERSTTSTEQRHILDELQQVAHALFNDTTAFRDPGYGSSHVEKSKDETPAAPVSLDDLIVHLDESSNRFPTVRSVGASSLSLNGILRLLFNTEADEDASSVAAKDEDIDEGKMEDDDIATPPKKTAEKASDGYSQPTPIEDRFRERLAAEIDNFLTAISSSAFAEKCSVTQMVQAVSFPLAVALRGQRSGWVSSESAEKWALKVFSILFRGKNARTGGLLRVVEYRYAKNDQKSTYDNVVGDGTLWMVLVATLGNTTWQGVGTDIDKAVILREIFTSPQLLATAIPARITDLIRTIRIEDARSYLANVAPTVTRLLNEIEGELDLVWEAELTRQEGCGITHKAGDLLWHKKGGWAICLAKAQAKAGQLVKVRLRGIEMNVTNGYYVNVLELTNRTLLLANLIKDLRLAVSISGSTNAQAGPLSHTASCVHQQHVVAQTPTNSEYQI